MLPEAANRATAVQQYLDTVAAGDIRKLVPVTLQRFK
jgi:hypothetical protein